MRKYFAVFVLSCVCLSTAIVLSACESTVIGREYKRISDYRYASYIYENENYVLDIYCGVRETPYLLDGKSSSEKTPYTVFVLRPAEGYSFGADEPTVSFEVNGDNFSATLTQHPYRESYSAEVPVAVEEGASEFGVRLCGEDVTAAAAPHNVDGEYALTLAMETLGDAAKKGEICLRLTENTVTAESGWYWFVSFNDGENVGSVLISADSGEVRAVRNS